MSEAHNPNTVEAARREHRSLLINRLGTDLADKTGKLFDAQLAAAKARRSLVFWRALAIGLFFAWMAAAAQVVFLLNR